MNKDKLVDLILNNYDYFRLNQQNDKNYKPIFVKFVNLQKVIFNLK